MKQYNLSSYRDLLKKLDLLKTETVSSTADVRIHEITYNSKEVVPGTLFVCKGANFKEGYLVEAIKNGAVGYVSEAAYDSAASIPGLIVSDVRQAMPYLADLFFNSPSKQLKIVAVGGTKGKTTTTHYIKAIIDACLKDQGKQESGLISSIKVFDGLAEYPAANTTPEAIPLQRYLANAVAAGLEYMVIEVSSQALKYNRVDCVQFEVGVFLNISNDHISPLEHENFEDYFESKMKMFQQTKIAIINADTSAYDRVLAYTNHLDHVYTYSKENQKADYYGYEIESDRLQTSFKVNKDEGINDFYLGMPGAFNFENAIAAIATTTSLGIPIHYAQESLKTAQVPGRMEFFESKNGMLTTVVDYAHNKLSFESLFPMLRCYFSNAHLIAVFGVVGGKALNRRQELSEIVGEYADEVIFTMIHPDMEDPEDINRTLTENIQPYGIAHQSISDRGEAIREAIQSAKVNQKTLVVVTGRGHEDYQKIKGKIIKTPTDLDYVQKYMEEYDRKTTT